MANVYNRWSLEEKKRLAELLEIYPINAYHSIAKRLAKKSEDEVRTFIEKMKYSAMTYNSAKPITPKETKAPLEEWLLMASRLVEQESFDASAHLSKVMSIIGHLEEFPESSDHPPVDYPSIYRYLGQIMQGNRMDDVDPLQPLECSIVLDMIHSLMDVLSATDLTVQRNVMKWKCELMDKRDDEGKPMPQSLRKAAENDFKEFMQEEEEKWSRNLMEANAKQKAEEEAELAEQAIKREHGTLDNGQILMRSTYTLESSNSATPDKRTEDPDMVSITTSSGNLYTYQRSWKHKPGRKSKLAPEETPITDIVVVMPPKNVKIINPAPRRKKVRKERIDGKYQSVDKSVEIKKIAAEKHNSVNIVETEPPGTSTAEPADKGAAPAVQIVKPKRIAKKEVDFDALLQLYEERKRKHEQIKESAAKHSKKKPKLYTINPFCIPVSLLDLDS